MKQEKWGKGWDKGEERHELEKTVNWTNHSHNQAILYKNALCGIMVGVMALTSGSGWISSISTVTASGTSTPESPDSSATPLAACDPLKTANKETN